jgi:hypothetical protein
VRLENGELMLQPPVEQRPVPMVFYAADRAIGREAALKYSRMEFLRDAQGQVVWLRLQGRIHARQE